MKGRSDEKVKITNSDSYEKYKIKRWANTDS